jgi:predicted transporter
LYCCCNRQSIFIKSPKVRETPEEPVNHPSLGTLAVIGAVVLAIALWILRKWQEQQYDLSGKVEL